MSFLGHSEISDTLSLYAADLRNDALISAAKSAVKAADYLEIHQLGADKLKSLKEATRLLLD